ncbi:uncharacterized protein LOC120774452 [Bactrocera tryoni]|uniref:uncharacterized protein LOC120774452 n=1 Tax=Bactrocera tryoni TaxID=59916 RepID=UPI001A960C9E|nr:uncharacterized protein LOC120774452 [Bactrocera tryoni]
MSKRMYVIQSHKLLSSSLIVSLNLTDSLKLSLALDAFRKDNCASTTITATKALTILTSTKAKTFTTQLSYSNFAVSLLVNFAVKTKNSSTALENIVSKYPPIKQQQQQLQY